MSNRVCKVLGIEKPVICGPMAWVTTAPLVAAVSKAGGIGILGVGFAPMEFAMSQIEETKKLTDKPFGVNVVMVPQILDHVTQMVQTAHVPVVYADTLEAADGVVAQKYFKLWHDAGSKIIVKVGDVESAVTYEKAGADIVVAKGWEGGGHVSFEATIVLTPLIKDAVHIPVVASGGIADGRGMAAAIALGADGIEMGTAFMTASEGTIHENAKRAVVNAADMQNVVTGYSTGAPCRQIRNSLSDRLQKLEAEHPYSEVKEELERQANNSLKIAMMAGDTDERGAVMASQAAPLVKEIKPAKAIIDDTITQCKETLKNMAAFEM